MMAGAAVSSTATSSPTGVISKPILPSRTPAAVMARLSPDRAERLTVLSRRLAGGAGGSLTTSEMGEFEALTGGNGMSSYLNPGGFFTSGVGSYVNPGAYSWWGLRTGNPYLLNNVYARYKALGDKVTALLQQLASAPELQNSAAALNANQSLLGFWDEMNKEVATLQIQQIRNPAATTVDRFTLAKLENNERRFNDLDSRFQAFVQQARAFRVQPTYYPQSALQALGAPPRQPPQFWQQPFRQPQFGGPGFVPQQFPQYAPQAQQQLQRESLQALAQQQAAIAQQEALLRQAKDARDSRDASLAWQLQQQQLQQQQQQQQQQQAAQVAQDAAFAQRLQQQQQQQQQQQYVPYGPSPFGDAYPSYPQQFASGSQQLSGSVPQFETIGNQLVFSGESAMSDPFYASQGQAFAPV
jgi:hypothetical protein